MKKIKYYDNNKLDSLFYGDSPDPIAEVEYKNRRWAMYVFGEVEMEYDGERYYNASDICSNDLEFDQLCESDTVNIIHNNWYEIRPILKDENDDLYKYVNAGMYDDIYGDPGELFSKDLLDRYIAAEQEFDKEGSFYVQIYI